MAAGMVNMSHYGRTANASYILRSGECDTYYSNMGLTREEIIGKVKQYCDMEALGNRALAIRANADPRNMTKLIISLPNANTDDQNIAVLEKLLDKTGVSAYPHIVAIHRGVKDGIENRHAHVSFFERKFEKGDSKKNRYFSGKEFLPDFKKEYQRQFGFTDNEQQKDRKPFKQFEEIKRLVKESRAVEREIEKATALASMVEIAEWNSIHGQLLEDRKNARSQKVTPADMEKGFTISEFRKILEGFRGNGFDRYLNTKTGVTGYNSGAVLRLSLDNEGFLSTLKDTQDMLDRLARKTAAQATSQGPAPAVPLPLPAEKTRPGKNADILAHPAVKRMEEKDIERLLNGERVKFKAAINLSVDLQVENGKVVASVHDFYRGGRAWKAFREDPAAFLEEEGRERKRGQKLG